MSVSSVVEILTEQMDKAAREYKDKISQINKAMDEIERHQVEADDAYTLYLRLSRAIGELEPGREIPALTKDPIADPPPETVKEPKRTKPLGVKGESANSRYRKFRDWVVQRSDHENGFTKDDVREVFGLTSVEALFSEGKKRQLIEKIGFRSTGNKGRQPNLYRYVKKVEEAPLTPTSNGSAEARGKGGGPVALSATRIPKDLMEIIGPALKAGATVSRTGSGHYRLEEPGKHAVIIASTPSDRRARKNLKARLRRERYAVS